MTGWALCLINPGYQPLPPGTSLKKSTLPRHLPVAEIAACVVSGGFLAQSGPPVHLARVVWASDINSCKSF